MNLQEFGKVVVPTTKFVITDSVRKEVMMKIVLVTSQILYGATWTTFQQNDHILEVIENAVNIVDITHLMVIANKPLELGM